ncbi:tyrosine-type recombinase/integrase [Yoonia sp. 2307UL14-13]|uniref:tyrosine-type recombinase/integrase n=1 Tax=Yoonia sp. 2307UL14-13 TaxID=3126506 RepID=UPI0030995EA5
MADPNVVQTLEPRSASYFNIIQYCRHVGVLVRNTQERYWVARFRRKDGGYTHKRLCPTKDENGTFTSFEAAVDLANQWFATPEVTRIAAEPYQIGSKRTLSICPIGDTYSVGHALQHYLEWKLLAATASHYETIVSLTNYHLVPHIAHIPLRDFNARHFNDLARTVLQTRAKRGRPTIPAKCDIKDLTPDQLRTRKKTFNALVSILRGSFEIASEHGHLSDDRPLRCLRRLPNIDRPRVIFLDRDQCRRMLIHCHPDLRDLVSGALYTGCRANELISLTAGDLDVHMRSVFIAHPKGRRTRHVLLPDEGLRFFCELAKDKSPQDRLFRKTNGRLWGGEYKTYFQRARSNAALSERLTFHGLRHTYASQLLQNGASMLTVADQLGHANTQTVAATYAHLTNWTKAQEVERFFEPLSLSGGGKADVNERTNQDTTSLPVFIHNPPTSWPRANHSRYSGPLLRSLREHK